MPCTLITQSLLGSKEARNNMKLFTMVTFFIMQRRDALQEPPSRDTKGDSSEGHIGAKDCLVLAEATGLDFIW